VWLSLLDADLANVANESEADVAFIERHPETASLHSPRKAD
jgi:hypothetical protein